MGRIDDIIANHKELAEELQIAKQQERDDVLKDIKEKIKVFDYKASDFKGMFKSRVTQKQLKGLLKRKETYRKVMLKNMKEHLGENLGDDQDEYIEGTIELLKTQSQYICSKT